MKYVVSACLLGRNCKYSGGNNFNEKLVKFLEGHEVIEVCPEVEGGLPTPRVPVELVNGIAINKDGVNVHKEFSKGVELILKRIEGMEIEACILQPRSPSCGKGKRYDGTFSGTLMDGNGLLAQALLDAGYKVLTVDEI